MEKVFRTEQEIFWAGEFGDNYINRNMEKKMLASKVCTWNKILQHAGKINTCLEMGPNIGLNLVALGVLLPQLVMFGVEINQKAAEECSKIDCVTVYNESILDFSTDKKYDLVFTSGVLIHINPDELPSVYDKMYNFSSRYIVVAEYYNTTPVDVDYRGNTGKLFKRDFAGEMMDRHPDLKLVDYGFIYHRDNNFPDDDITWFLLEK